MKEDETFFEPTVKKDWIRVKNHVIDLNSVIELETSQYNGEGYTNYYIYFYFINKQTENIKFDSEADRDKAFNKIVKLLNATAI